MAPKKKVLATAKLQIVAAQATPAPPVGTALGQHGVNIMEFCKQYNEATQQFAGQVIPVELTIYEDRSFSFVLKQPPAAELIRKAAGDREGLRRAQPGEGRTALPGSGPSDRRAQDGRPERQRHRQRHADHRRNGAEHGRGGGVVSAKPGKRFRQAAETFDREQEYLPADAIKILKSLPDAKFDETVEIAFRLGIDPRKNDQALRGTVALPHGSGKSVRVGVFAAGDKAREAREAGADVVGGDELVEEVMKGVIDFDATVATPDMMASVGKAGRVLGPRGLMPNPKTGTVTNDIAKAVADIKGGKVEYRADRTGNVHLIIGKKSFEERNLLENYMVVVDELLKAKPASAKGRYIKSLAVSSTMGPSVRIDPAKPRGVQAAVRT